MRFRMTLAALFLTAAAFQSAPGFARTCQPPQPPKGEEFVVLAAGAYAGRRLDIQIDQSGNQATQIDVMVNTGAKPVILLLGAYEPSTRTRRSQSPAFARRVLAWRVSRPRNHLRNQMSPYRFRPASRDCHDDRSKRG